MSDLTAHQVRVMSAHGMLHPKTVRRAYGGLVVQSTSYARIELAARQLGYPPPPPRVASERERAAKLRTAKE